MHKLEIVLKPLRQWATKHPMPLETTFLVPRKLFYTLEHRYKNDYFFVKKYHTEKVFKLQLSEPYILL